MEESNIKHTAIYEAGHAVANVRIDVLKDQITIDPGEGLLGGSIAEGKNHVWNAKDAAKQVYSYCAGYAALMALGYSAEVPCLGAGDDYVEMLVEWADGNMTDEEWRQFVSFQYPGMV